MVGAGGWEVDCLARVHQSTFHACTSQQPDLINPPHAHNTLYRDGLTLDRFVVEHRHLAEAIEGTRQKLDPTALRRVSCWCFCWFVRQRGWVTYVCLWMCVDMKLGPHGAAAGKRRGGMMQWNADKEGLMVNSYLTRTHRHQTSPSHPPTKPPPQTRCSKRRSTPATTKRSSPPSPRPAS